MPSDTRPDLTIYFPINRLLSLNLGCVICPSNLSKNQSKSGSFQLAQDPGLEVFFTKKIFLVVIWIWICFLQKKYLEFTQGK